jgi:hypothetical protein
MPPNEYAQTFQNCRFIGTLPDRPRDYTV